MKIIHTTSEETLQPSIYRNSPFQFVVTAEPQEATITCTRLIQIARPPLIPETMVVIEKPLLGSTAAVIGKHTFGAFLLSGLDPQKGLTDDLSKFSKGPKCDDLRAIGSVLRWREAWLGFRFQVSVARTKHAGESQGTGRFRLSRNHQGGGKSARLPQLVEQLFPAKHLGSS